jgi:DNA-binding LacI/PurR family transcriptional regulator
VKPQLVVDNPAPQKAPSPEASLRQLLRKRDRLARATFATEQECRAEALRYADKHGLKVVPHLDRLRAVLGVK